MSETAVATLIDGAASAFTFGCDYNPEQWSPETWLEDARLMNEAGVTLVALNIFGWAQLEPVRGSYDFEALDTIIELLHDHGIGINLGTATSSPPPWFSADYPESLPTMADGTTRAFGGRQAFCPSSPAYREHSLALVEKIAERYGAHPAVRLWHVSNEIGCHNAHCYCDTSAVAFREWLKVKYGRIDDLNDAWGTSFWSQRYAAWEHIQTPRLTVSTGNPGQALDFMRFSSDELLEHYKAEQAILRKHSAAPVTTNFMVTAHIRNQDYWAWAPHMDVIANDHYLDHRLGDARAELSFAADATRGLAGGRPWMLMEQATSAVNWQPLNIAKAPGEMIRNTLSHVARGADGISFFQWRASLQGSEKFHSAMLPHAGTDSTVWREVVELSGILQKLAEVTGSVVEADVAIVFDWQAWWATDLDSHPSADVRYLPQVHAAYNALLGAGVTVDIVAPGAPVDGYRLVVVPSLYSVTDAATQVLADYVAAGGHAVVTFFSGIVDENDRVRPGGYPGAFRELLGVRSEEFVPIHPSTVLELSDGQSASLWSERLRLEGAEAISVFTNGPVPGVAAVTRNPVGDGAAWYLATALDEASLSETLVRAARDAGVEIPVVHPSGVEIVRRVGPFGSWVFVINHSDAAYEYRTQGTEIITGAEVGTRASAMNETSQNGTLDVPAGAVRVVRESRK
ncbi:beta-galactosidase [Agreia bicolorata]|uniref:Beta-galactosidase n=1 Tax=Agreia bicolorata TaxID=110935 RepID=A0A1T4YH07_9MICO|nr:beta-galactosidase [Agreia bicolorata]SKB00983.1 beta-galactosidase [Agreia bicolorata]